MLTPEVCSAGHFQYNSLTQFFYPIFVDTVDLGGDTLAVGDEIGVLDGDKCVGGAVFTGSFPIRMNAWQDDMATEDTIDGYIEDHEMTFVWFNASENTESEFIPPPGTMAMEDDPVAPTHSGFGAGFYAVRSFTDGIQMITQLPTEFKLRQNYPNPFNAETVIPLELPQRSSVRVELFNVRGQKLGLIYEGIEEAGWPRLHLRPANLSSGLYFCRVTADGLERKGRFEGINKILLLK